MKKIKIAGLQELLPWLCPVTEGLVLQKDGSLLANYEIGGIDIDHRHEETLDAAREALDRACAPFSDDITMWWRVDHRSTQKSIPGDMPNQIAQMVNEHHLRSIARGSFYENKHYLSLTCTPQTGLDKFFEKVGLHMDNNKSMFRSIVSAIKETIFSGNSFSFAANQTKSQIKYFENLLNGFDGATPFLKLRRLELTDQYQFLHQCANPAVPPRSVQFPTALMDNALAENVMTGGSNMLLFESVHGKKYVAALAVKEIPTFTKSGILDSILAVDAEVSLCTMYRFLGKDKAHKIIKDIERHYRFTQFNLRNILRIILKQEEEVDSGRLQIAAEANDALRRITAENLQFGYANTTIFCYGDTQEECALAVSKVAKALSLDSFSCIQEDFNITSAFASSLPGQWREQERLQLISTPNISDLAPIRTTWPGEDINHWLSEQSGKTQYALTILPTRFKTLTKVNLHVQGGSGHLMVLGPTGAGKSVFMNFLTYQTDRYKPRRYTFDRDRSCRISTLMNGGKFIDITGKYETATKVNPLCLLKDPKHIPYVIEWIQLAIESYGDYSCNALDIKEISDAVTHFSHMPPERFRLLNFTGLLSEHLKDQLAPWVEGGKEARFFDHVEDAFDLTDEVCIEMGELMDNHQKAAALAIDYFFYRITDSLSEGDSRPTYIKIEEGSFFITHPLFSKRLNDATVTVRKRNGSIWLGTQSLQQIKEAPGFMILHENFKNKLYLPNESANKELYMNTFGLTYLQYMMIKSGVPNRDYLWVNSKINRLFEALLPREIVAVTRSDERAQNIFDKHYRNRETGWEKNYVSEILADFES